MQRYVLGFVFSKSEDRVLLIEKSGSIPAHKGLLNGLGGKIEEHELPREAIAREVQEESGLDIPATSWYHTLCLCLPDSKVYVYRTFVDDVTLSSARAMTHESIHVYSTNVALTSDKVVPNLRWLIPFQLDRNVTQTVNYIKTL